MDLDTPIGKIPKTGDFFAKRLKNLKISTLEDLIYHFPTRYENIGPLKKIADLRLGEVAATQGKVLEIRNVRTRFGKNLTLSTFGDSSGFIEIVWFNQPFLIKTIKPADNMAIAGKIDLFSHKPTFVNPEYEILKSKRPSLIHTSGFVSVYPETSRVSSKWLRARISEVLPEVLAKISEILPKESLIRNSFIGRRAALWQIHFPKTKAQIEEARRRLAFDELFLTHLQSLQRKKAWQAISQGRKMQINQEKLLQLISNLPFELTRAQIRVLKEVLADLASGKSMNRLIQGDVGSGKTVVAATAAYEVFLNGAQSTLMAPTEILALQHYDTIKNILAPYGVRVAIRTGSRKKMEPFDILIGTHALISKDVKFENLGLVIIDEQHRFGVAQRALLRSKGAVPHVLSLTATPIPRSLALTFYGDLDVSVIDELPAGRPLVKTYVVPLEKRGGAYQFIRKQILHGRQVFIICPLIETSETLKTVKAATAEYERLTKEVFPDLAVGLLHGKLTSKEKEQILGEFRNRRTQILVATPVVEVGIDIPNATVMMIEAAERFGLASLHQLRGRVGRGADASYCFLFTESSSRAAQERLSSLEKHHVGYKLAEIDLDMRGPGEIYGTAQSGLPNFKLASLSDLPLIEAARKEASYLFANNKTNIKQPLSKINKQLVGPD